MGLREWTIDQVRRTVWDAVVIGAGPAGAMAARQLALRGVRVVLIERKPFPRAKVCGGCLNRRALSVLDAVGLATMTDRLDGSTIERLEIVGFGRRLIVPLPGGLAVTRAALDAALVESAVEAGACFLPRTEALVLPLEDGADHGGTRAIRLQWAGGRPCVATARVVLAADGLGHSSLRRLDALKYRVDAGSRIGVGATIHGGPVGEAAARAAMPRPGTVRMLVADGGYVGMVRTERGELNVAAALDRQVLKRHHGPAGGAASILTEMAVELPAGWGSAAWQATPPLTCDVVRPVCHRVIAIGDAAGYVEPFTGEGIAWALWAGRAVAPALCQGIRRWSPALERAWLAIYRREVVRRQRWCRRLARILRSATATRLALQFVSRFPALARPVVAQLNAFAEGSEVAHR